MTSIRARIASAVRWANVVYLTLPDEDAREEFGELWVHLERTVTTAEVAGDDRAITAAIDRWRTEVMGKFGGSQ